MSNFIDNFSQIFDSTKTYNVGETFLHEDMLYIVSKSFKDTFANALTNEYIKPLYMIDIVSCNNKFNYSNENLLDNPFFNANSRGQSSYSTEGYSVDRWIIRNGTLNVNSDGIDIAWDGTTENQIRFEQLLDIYNDLIGKTVTLSAIYDDTLYFCTFNDLQNNTHTYSDFGNGLVLGLNFNSGWGNTARPFQLLSNSTTAKSLKAVKLELGSISTLAHDVAPNVITETIKCQTSTADSTDMYANKPKNLASNENLLDNGWFTVNTVGQSSYSALGYTVDRWQKSSNNTLTVESNGVKISGDSYDYLFQKIKPLTANTTYTLSMLYKCNIQQSCYLQLRRNNYAINKPQFTSEVSNDWVLFTSTFTTASDVVSTDLFQVYMYMNYDKNQNAEFSIKAIKLELGTVSTLPLDDTPNLALETYKCRTSTADSTDIYANKTVSYT